MRQNFGAGRHGMAWRGRKGMAGMAGCMLQPGSDQQPAASSLTLAPPAATSPLFLPSLCPRLALPSLLAYLL